MEQRQKYTTDKYHGLETYSTSCGHHTVWNQVQTEPHRMEHVFEELYDLKSQHVLSDVIPHFEYGSLPHCLGGQLGGESDEI